MSIKIIRQKFRPTTLEEFPKLEKLSPFAQAVYSVFYTHQIQEVDSQFPADILNELVQKGYLEGFYKKNV